MTFSLARRQTSLLNKKYIVKYTLTTNYEKRIKECINSYNKYWFYFWMHLKTIKLILRNPKIIREFVLDWLTCIDKIHIYCSVHIWCISVHKHLFHGIKNKNNHFKSLAGSELMWTWNITFSTYICNYFNEEFRQGLGQVYNSYSRQTNFFFRKTGV